MKTAVKLLLLFNVLATTAFAQRSDKEEGVKLKLNSIEINGDTLLLNLHLKNRSLVSYHWAELRVFAKDRHVPKRTAVQETEFDPIKAPSLPSLAAKSDTSLTVEFAAFTIPHNKLFIIQTAEIAGTRVLIVRIKGRRFMRLLKKKGII